MTISLPGSLGRLRSLIASHRSSVEALLRRAGVPAGDAPDGAQRVFLVAARRLDDVPPEKERAFLLAVARRVALDARRAARRRPTATDDLPYDVVDTALLPDDRLDHARARSLVDRALASMDDDLREVFVLARIEERSLSEIAEELAIPRGTAASRLRRANARFEDAITREEARAAHARVVARRAGLLAWFPRWFGMRAAIAVSTSAAVFAPTADAPTSAGAWNADARAAGVEFVMPTRSPAPRLDRPSTAPHADTPTRAIDAPPPMRDATRPAPAVGATRPASPARPRAAASTTTEIAAAPMPSSEANLATDVPVTPPSADALLAELRSLEAVRAAAARGDTNAARALLEAHRTAFPSGDLGPEASLLGADVAAGHAGGRSVHAR